MDADRARSAATRLLRRRPLSVLPPFVAEAGVQAVGQLGLGLVAVTMYLVLRGTGRFDRVVDAVETLPDGQQPTPEELGTVVDAVLGLFTPPVLVAVVVGVALVVLARAAVGAAKVHVARALLSDDVGEGDTAAGEQDAEVATDGGMGTTPALTAAVQGTLADTGRFVGITLLRGAVVLVPTVLGLAISGWRLTGLVVLTGVAGVVAAYVGFLFVAEAVVVDDVGPVAALRRNATYLRRRPARAGTYVAIELVVYVVTGLVSLFLLALGVSRAFDLLTLFLVFPLLGLFRMGLYLPDAAADPDPAGTGETADADAETSAEMDADTDPGDADEWTGPDTPDEPGEATADGRGGVLGTVRTGVTELRRFVAEHAGLVALALGLFLAGAVAGRVLVPGTPRPITEDPTRVFGTFPVDFAVRIAVNNWLVAVTESYAGLAAGLPTVGVLLLNGLVVGVTSGLFEPVQFLAFVLPHGVIEVPAIAVGGGLGLHLARVGSRVARGRSPPATLGGELRRALLVLLGLVPVFVVAAVVEAFVTPLVAGLVV